MPLVGTSRGQVRADIATQAQREARGIALPNPLVKSLWPLPQPMATPPTVTVGNATPTLTGWQRKPNSQHLRFLGFDTPLASPATNPTRAVTYCATNSGANLAPTSVDFDFCPPTAADNAFEIGVSASGSARTWQLWVDDELAAAPYYSGAQGIPNTVGVETYIKVDFGSDVRERHIRIVLEEVVFFYGIQTTSFATIGYPRRPKGPKIAIVGDSFTTHNFINLTQWYEAWPYACVRALGGIDVASLGIGSTGFLATGAANGNKYSTRLAEFDHITPDLVILQSSYNDRSGQGFAPADVAAEATSYIPQLRAKLPARCPIVMLGPFWSASTGLAQAAPVYDSTLVALDAALQPVGQSLADAWIGPLGRGWIQGNGSVQSPNGTGNADLFMSSAHPNAAGAAFIGSRVAAQIVAQLPITRWT